MASFRKTLFSILALCSAWFAVICYFVGLWQLAEHYGPGAAEQVAQWSLWLELPAILAFLVVAPWVAFFIPVFIFGHLYQGLKRFGDPEPEAVFQDYINALIGRG